MPFLVTPLYAGLAAIILLVLTVRVILLRRRLAVGIGSGGHDALELAIRCHGNFTEYVPVVLILLASAELSGAGAGTLHAIGILLIVGRMLHAWGLAQSRGTSFGRAAGIVLTVAALVFGIVANLTAFFGH
jgi:uncharacterized membrane protein YecN with MAPEG domain